MPKPDLLLTGPMMPLILEQTAAAFTVHRLDQISDREAFLASKGAGMVAIGTGAHTGVKTDAALLDRLPNVKVIANFGVGYDSIDVAAAAKRGIIVTNTPDVLTEEVADTALGLLLMTVRELPHAERWLRAGRWAKEGDYPLTRGSLRDRKLGIIGLGRIGQAIATRVAAFGMPIVYHSRTKKQGVTYPYYDNLVAMARDVDILLAITPGGAETKNMINRAVLDALGSNGILINIARGSVVDEPELIAALREKRILSAGLDVYWNEPKIDPAFLTLDNVVLLPHVASASIHTRNGMAQMVVDNLVAYVRKTTPPTPVPETPFKSW